MPDEIANFIQTNRERLLEDLQECLRQPSFAANNEGMHEGAALTRQILERRGLNTKILETSGHPAVFAEAHGRSSRTILLYQHYDVLPPGDLGKWSSDPFAAEIRDGKIYARGAADHKGSFMARVHAVEALQATEGLPLNVKFLVEGEEELGSPHLLEIVDRYRDDLSADAALYSGWWKDEADRPRMNCGMRGGFKARITARTADHGLHGRHAPLVPNAAWRLTWALASLKSADELVRVDGFYDDVDPLSEEDRNALAAIPFDGDTLKQQLGIDAFLCDAEGLEAVRRQVFEPAITVRDIVVGDGSVADVPCIARADASFRLVPSQDPEDILEKLRAHFASEGFSDIEVEPTSPLGEPARVPLSHPIVRVVQEAGKEVYGTEPIVIPLSSGSGPRYVFVNKLGVPMVADPGVGYDDQRDHGFDENIRVQDYLDGIHVMANILRRYAAS